MRPSRGSHPMPGASRGTRAGKPVRPASRRRPNTSLRTVAGPAHRACPSGCCGRSARRPRRRPRSPAPGRCTPPRGGRIALPRTAPARCTAKGPYRTPERAPEGVPPEGSSTSRTRSSSAGRRRPGPANRSRGSPVFQSVPDRWSQSHFSGKSSPRTTLASSAASAVAAAGLRRNARYPKEKRAAATAAPALRNRMQTLPISLPVRFSAQ
mmetsp:Transcript_28022/g.65851  ORF Transcript_28022/g.65851 Transcript_28022/m.65851 type:complete len:210 (+) Transcript_28022:841-1470(+)